MSVELPRLPRDAPDASVVDALEAHGAVIVRDLLTPSQIAAISTELSTDVAQADPEMEHVNDNLGEFFAGVRNVTGLVGRSRTFAGSVLTHPKLLAVADEILGPNCATYALNVAHLMGRMPDAPAQRLHRDEGVWSFLPLPHREVELAAVIALDDFTAANGATVVVPGSHRWPRDRTPRPDETTTATMPAGSAVIYLGSTIHGGGPNSTDRVRTGVHLSYVVGWLRSEENNTLAVAPAVARTLPRRAQELVGYAMHDATKVGGGYLGCVDLRDPVELLAAGAL